MVLKIAICIFKMDKFYEVFEEKKKVYIVLEYAKHGNLFYYLHKYKRYPPALLRVKAPQQRSPLFPRPRPAHRC